MRLRAIHIILLVVLSVFRLYAQDDVISFKVIPSKTRLGLSERLRVDFEMNKDGDNFIPPDFEGFTVVSGPNQSVSRSWINGKSSYSKTYSYFLSPLGKGLFTINQAKVEIGGKIYKTTPIKITVVKSTNKTHGNAFSPTSDVEIYLDAEISNTNPYINETVSVVYKLYFNSNTEIQINSKDPADYKNFWNKEIPINRMTLSRGTFRGNYYNYVVCHEVVLYPQKSGKLKIDPLSMSLSVSVPNGRVDFFGRQLYDRVQENIVSSTRMIEVKPLPERGHPDDFSGAVGRFNFSVHTSRNSLKTTESLSAILKLSGVGNMNLIKLPKLIMPSSIEVYEPEYKESLKTTRSGVRGEISERYTLVPQYRGDFNIPKIKFTYFDPRKASYVSIYSNIIPFSVTQGQSINTATSIPSPSGGVNKKRIASTSDTHFRFIKINTELQPVKTKVFLNSSLFFILLSLPLFLILLIVLIYKRKARIGANGDEVRLRNMKKLAKKYLSDAKKQIGQEEKFYIALERALHNFLKAKIKLETSEFSKDRIKDVLLSRGVEASLVDEFIRIISDCEMARYAPTSTPVNEDDYDRAVRIITQTDKQIK